MSLHPVILAGGTGTRLWPLSRRHLPKQFLPLTSEQTLFQETLTRLDDMPNTSEALIICSVIHKDLVVQQVAELGKSFLMMILEPEGRNTAPALTLAALALEDSSRNTSCQPLMLTMPADHVIHDSAAFRKCIEAGGQLASEGYLVTFGISPTSAQTGYGYIRKGTSIDNPKTQTGIKPLRLLEFTEKPDLVNAQSYLESGDYLWNSGIFMMPVDLWLKEIHLHNPKILAACKAAYDKAQRNQNLLYPETKSFVSCPNVSIDYAVMEKITSQREGNPDIKCAVIPLDAGWSDVGSWSAVWEESPQDAQRNVIQGDVYAEAVENSLLIAKQRILAAFGLKNIAIVETQDAVLVAPMDRVQHVKDIVDRINVERGTKQADSRQLCHRWGVAETLVEKERFQVNCLTIDPGGSLDIQNDGPSTEFWVIIKGSAKVETKDKTFTLYENQSLDVSSLLRLNLRNPGASPLEIIVVRLKA